MLARREKGARMNRQRLLPMVIGLVAVVGVVLVLWKVFPFSSFPKCRLVAGMPVSSPQGGHFAVSDDTVCDDPSRSRSTVSIGAQDKPERLTVMDFQRQTKVTLSWDDEDNLSIAYPGDAPMKTYGPYQGWPSITARPE